MTENLLALTTTELIRLFKQKFPVLCKLCESSSSSNEFEDNLKQYILENYQTQSTTTTVFAPKLEAALRVIDTLEASDKTFDDPARETTTENASFSWLWEAFKTGKSDCTPDFFVDMYHLFGALFDVPTETTMLPDPMEMMQRWPSGLDSEVLAIQEQNKKRIIELLVEKVRKNKSEQSKYYFTAHQTPEQQFAQVKLWWGDYRFHLAMAVRTPEELNYFLGNTLSEQQMTLFKAAQQKGIPFFVTPYYLSLLNTTEAGYDDFTIRSYVLYTEELVETFGRIKAWEKEDKVVADKPNAAGWLLPNNHNIHRRYPEVAILIPDTMGRACGGLCSSCQRMYNFQSGRLNFELDKLKPKSSWWERLRKLMDYYEYDSQLRDILITGGDALMSRSKSLEIILEEVYQMALRKREANKGRPDGEKYAEIIRVRLGSRLPAYLPSRVNDELIRVLSEFKLKAKKAGIRQLVIQTHFQSPLEVTHEAAAAVKALLSAGWLVTNQLVYTVAASRRGHAAKLRQVLNGIGVIPYYTFSVKGHYENYAYFTPNSRSVQAEQGEKQLGALNPKITELILKELENPQNLDQKLTDLMKEHNIPFLATDRNVLNLPGVGKSLTFKTIGLTADGRRILEFSHDATRKHSPLIDKDSKVIIVENKSIAAYLRQLETLGERSEDYAGIWGFSRGNTEPRFKIFEYPDYEFTVTKKLTNI